MGWRQNTERRTDMSTSTLGIIGTGSVGAGVARRAVDAGLHVVVSNSRGPETLTELVASLGTNARAATPSEVARTTDVILAAVPFAAHEQLSRADLAGKIVIDPMNYVVTDEWRRPELDRDELTSSELVQRHLADSKVVKAFHSIGSPQTNQLFRDRGAADRTALPLHGDHPEANKEVAALLDALGFDAVDLGPLAGSWRTEPGTPLYASAYVGEPPTALTPAEWVAFVQAAPGVPLSAARLEELAAATERGPAGFRW
ncbi:NADPH-dependent F420 reductase [Lentzea sp. NPDC059081]|uniref:NADPH-dependent F420 reductase n=1 Tax=Lentzea sp. NPDC059081 TaxID=3346719 RepID=UPI00369C260E